MLIMLIKKNPQHIKFGIRHFLAFWTLYITFPSIYLAVKNISGTPAWQVEYELVTFCEFRCVLIQLREKV